MKNRTVIAVSLGIAFSILTTSVVPVSEANAADGHKQISASVTASNKIKVKWKPTTGVKYYQVRTAATADGKIEVKKYKTKKTSLTVKPTKSASAASGNYTFVRVYAYKKNGKIGISSYVKIRLNPTVPQADASRTSVATFNVRTAAEETKGHTWAQRLPAIAAQINSSGAEIIAVQEAGAVMDKTIYGPYNYDIDWQFEQLERAVDSKYELTNSQTYGDYGKEGTRILYDSSKYTLGATGVIDPGHTTKALTRWIPWAELIDSTGKKLYVISVHLDNRKDTGKSKKLYELRKEQTRSVVELAKRLGSGGAQVIIAGDFNSNIYSTPDNGAQKVAVNGGFYDTYATKNNINEFYFTANPKWTKPKKSASRTDYIFTYGLLKGSYSYKNFIVKSGVIPSDHYMQLAVLPY